MTTFRLSTNDKLFSGILGIAFSVMLFIQLLNKHFWLHDFEVYYSACKAMLQGDKTYGITFGLGSGFYKYSPFALFPFIPLALLPFELAKFIYFIILSASIISGFLCTQFIFDTNTSISPTSTKFKLLLLTVLISASHLFRELHLGNVNMILLFFLILCLIHIQRERYTLAALFLAVTILFKPHFIVLLPLLVLRKKFRVVDRTVLFIIIGLIVPVFLLGVDQTLILSQQWWKAMSDHNASVFSFQNTVYAWTGLGDMVSANPDSQFPIILGTLVLIASLFFMMILRHFKEEKREGENLRETHFLLEYFLLIALIPNITPTDTEHFLLSIPIVFYLLLLYRKTHNHWIKGIIIMSFLFYGADWGDLIGRSFSAWIGKQGVLGLGNMLMIGLAALYIHPLTNRIPTEKEY